MIERAEDLYQQAQKNKQISSQEMINIAAEIDIPSKYIQQAIAEYQMDKTKKGGHMKTSSSLKKEWIIIGLLVLVVGFILLRPQPPVQINNHVVVNSPPTEATNIVKIPEAQLVAELLLPNTSRAKPAVVEPKKEEPHQSKQLPPTAKAISPESILGNWYLVSYFVSDDGEYIEMPIAKTPIELRETWELYRTSFSTCYG